MNPVIAIQPNTTSDSSGGFVDIPWAEYIRKGEGSSAESAFGPNSNQATLDVLVPADDSIDPADVTDAILGSCKTAGPSATPAIFRTLPMRHPKYPQMWAKKITRVRGLKYESKSEVINSFTGQPSAFYRYNIMTILFTTVPYRVIGDTQLGNQFGGKEFHRYCEFTRHPSGEYLTIDRNNFKFAEGPGTIIGKDVSFGQTKLIPKEEIHIVWYEVPHLGLFDSTGPEGTPQNLDACVGKVNEFAFIGYPIGTLLFDSYRLTPVMMGCSPHSMGLDDKIDPPRAWNVEMILKHYEPPSGSTAIPPHQGWNLAPNFNSAGSEILFYLITTNGNPNGPTLYDSIDFNTAFGMIA